MKKIKTVNGIATVILLKSEGMYSFVHSIKIHCTVKFHNSLFNDSPYTVCSVRTIDIWIFHMNAFKLLLSDLLQYQNHKKFLNAALPKHWSILPLYVADGYIACLKYFIYLSTAELAQY